MASFGDINKRDNTTNELTVLFDRVRPILRWETRPIAPKHHFVVDMYAFVFAKSAIDPTFLNGIGVSVGARVVNEIVHVLSEKLFIALETKEPGARRVGKRAVAIHIDAVNPLAGRVEKQTNEFIATGKSCVIAPMWSVLVVVAQQTPPRVSGGQ